MADLSHLIENTLKGLAGITAGATKRLPLLATDNSDGTGTLVLGSSPAGQFPGSIFTSPRSSAAIDQGTSQTTAAGGALTGTVNAGGVGTTTYITGFDVCLGVGAAAASAAISVTGILNQMNYVATTNTTSGSILSVRYPTPIKATLSNLAITVNVPAVGGGAAVNAVSAYGFSQ